MRVIAGRFKGRRLIAPDDPDTRPVTDRVKEALFSSLGERVVGARVLDLYAGAGSFGIEALSRGAASAVFVERSPRALAALERNLEGLGVSPRLVRGTVERFLEADSGTFDVVFCDPPWALPNEELTAVLEALAAHLAPGGVVVVSRRASDRLPEPAGFTIADDRRYGDTRIGRYVTERGDEAGRGDPADGPDGTRMER